MSKAQKQRDIRQHSTWHRKKTEFEKKIVTKALAIQNIVKENLSSLQSTNTLFNFEPSKSVKLTKCGHDVLCKVE